MIRQVEVTVCSLLMTFTILIYKKISIVHISHHLPDA